jgi:hypothetical protein
MSWQSELGQLVILGSTLGRRDKPYRVREA